MRDDNKKASVGDSIIFALASLIFALLIDTNNNLINDSVEGMKIIFALPFIVNTFLAIIIEVLQIKSGDHEITKKQIILFYISLGIFIISIIMFIVKIIMSFTK